MADYTLSAKITGDSSGFDKAIQSAEKAASSFEKKMESISSKAKSIGDKLSGMGKTLSLGVTTPLTIAGKSAVNTAAEFESSMSRTQGALNLTSAEMEELKDLAMEMGAQTIFSAADAGDAMNELAKGGLTAADIQAGALKSTMDLAASSGMDMATSANTIVKAMGGFQLSASETGEAVNALAGAASASAADVSDISEALAQCSASANNAGWSIQDTTAVLGAFADAGVVGSDAGTSLKTMLQSLSAPTDKASELMSQLGIDVYDSNGHMLDAAGVAQELQTALAGLGDQQRAQALDTIFGSDATRAATILMNQGAEGIAKYTKATNDQTAASRLANAQLGPLQKSIENMNGSIETASIAIGETMAPYIQKAAEFVGNLANKFAEASPTVQKFVLIAAAIAAAAGPALIILGGMVSGFGSLVSILGAVLSPIGLIITAIAALSAGFVYLMNTNEQFRDAVLQVWDSISSKIQSVRDIISEIDFSGIFSGIISQLQTFLPSFESVFNTVKIIIGTVADAFSAFFSGLAGSFSGGLDGAEGFASGFMTVLGMISPPLKAIILLFQNFGPQIESLVSIIGSSLIPVFSTLGTTIGGIASAIMPAIQSALANLLPVISQIMSTVANLVSSILPVLVSLFNQLAPFLVQIAELIGQIFATLSPMIAQLVSTLLPVIQNIVTVVMNVIQSVMPALISILNVVMSVIQALAPVIMDILSVVISVVSNIISTISPIISFIGMVISEIMAIISPIVTFIANIIATVINVIGTIIGTVTGIFSTVYSVISGAWSNISQFISSAINTISTIISGLTNTVGGVFNSIYSVVSSIMNRVRSYITGVFNGIKSAWNGLTSFVSGVFSGIGSAVNSLVSTVKGFVNGVISGINAAIGLINMIPGVNIGRIPYLAHGTDDWKGGFAYMNEGGRGELTYLPNGAQVIPHDISVKYAKEAARANSGAESLDLSGLMEGMVIQVINNTNVDGTPLLEKASDFTIRKIGNQQKAVLKARGAFA